jgi:hypothetical protein
MAGEWKEGHIPLNGEWKEGHIEAAQSVQPATTPRKKSSTPIATGQRPTNQTRSIPVPNDGVPDWGRNHPNLYGLYGAAKGVLDQTFAGRAINDPNPVTLRTLSDISKKPMPGKDERNNIMAGSLGWALGAGTTANSLKPIVDMASKASNKTVGPITKQFLGRMTGAGKGMLDEAFQSGMAASPLKTTTNFSKAMRGKMDGEDVVNLAHDALRNIKSARTTAYQTELQNVQANQSPIDMLPIRSELSKLMNQYGIKVDPATGKLDLSRIAMGRAGRRDIKEVLEKVNSWGSQAGDDTAVGLDTLKRQLDDFYSDSSQARQFVSSIRDKVRQTIVNSVPEYDAMTRGYAEATKLIKDIESGLMMRKNGMTGRVTADMTLRRLSSAMRDNFTLRNDLVKELGAKGAEDVSGAIAGHTASSWVPRGMEGMGMGSGAAILSFFNPKMLPLLAASSPRVAGEFMQSLGYSTKIAKQIVKALPRTAKDAAAKLAAIKAAQNSTGMTDVESSVLTTKD